MRCLVTGGTGFIGSNIALELLNQGHEVIITGNYYEQNLPEFQGKTLYPSFIGLDFSRIGKVDALFHQAAINDTQFKDKSEIFRANVDSSHELFKHVIAAGCKHIVYASSTAVYGNLPAPYLEGMPLAPMNPYAESKIALEKVAEELQHKHHDVVFIGLRYCNVYGPREFHKGKLSTMIYQFAQQMQKGDPKMFKYGEQRRDYIYVKDVVKANLLAAKATKSGVVNCGSGKATTFNDIITLLNKVLGLNRKPVYIDNPYGKDYQSHTECNMDKAKELIGFVPEYDIEKGIKEYKESGFLIRN